MQTPQPPKDPDKDWRDLYKRRFWTIMFIIFVLFCLTFYYLYQTL